MKRTNQHNEYPPLQFPFTDSDHHKNELGITNEESGMKSQYNHEPTLAI